MNTYSRLKEQKKELEKVINQNPIDKNQKEAINQAKEYLIKINKILETLGE